MIRPATPADGPALAAIYNPYVLGTTITFEESALTPQEMASRVATVTQAHPWLVFETGGAVVGYAYASSWKARSAYRRTVESAIYVQASQAHRGIGRTARDEIRRRLEDLGHERCWDS